MSRPPVLVSACLIGLACRYDGQAKPAPSVAAHLVGRTVVPICPETAAGLGVPRAPFAFAHGEVERVIAEQRGLPNRDGRDVAPRLVPACRALTERATALGVREAILKERSPSCGVHQVYVGGRRVAGRGVLGALLARAGISLRSEEDLGEEPIDRGPPMGGAS